MKASTDPREAEAGVPGLIRLSGDDFLKALFESILVSFNKGYGCYRTDGSFDPKAPIFGSPLTPVSPTHRRILIALQEIILYSQGFSQLVEKLDLQDLVVRHDQCDMLYDELQLKRSQMLLNEHYKTGGKTIGITLSDFTSWGVANNWRNRSRVRDTIAPVFEYYGLWTVLRDEGGYAMFTAGPALLLFAECVLDQMPDRFERGKE